MRAAFYCAVAVIVLRVRAGAALRAEAIVTRDMLLVFILCRVAARIGTMTGVRSIAIVNVLPRMVSMRQLLAATDMNIGGSAACRVKRQAKGDAACRRTHVLIRNSGVRGPCFRIVTNFNINHQCPASFVAANKTRSRRTACIIGANSTSLNIFIRLIRCNRMLSGVSVDKWRTIAADIQRKRYTAVCG